jgi:hypothetical protein
MTRTLAILCAALALTACANSGSHAIGKDTYMATVRVTFTGVAGAKADALETASADCRSKGKAMFLNDLTGNGCMLRGGCAEAQIVYSCLDKSDPRYKEPAAAQEQATPR